MLNHILSGINTQPWQNKTINYKTRNKDEKQWNKALTKEITKSKSGNAQPYFVRSNSHGRRRWFFQYLLWTWPTFKVKKLNLFQFLCDVAIFLENLLTKLWVVWKHLRQVWPANHKWLENLYNVKFWCTHVRKKSCQCTMNVRFCLMQKYFETIGKYSWE